MVGVTKSFGGHEFVVKIDLGNFGYFAGVFQFFQRTDKRKRFFAAGGIGNLFQFFKHDG